LDRSHCREATAGSRYPEEWVDRVTVDSPAAAGAAAASAAVADWVAAADDEAAAAGASNSSADRTMADLCNNGPSNRRD
jgi:hypothetical protein